ncbi:hypothetical protein Q5P01_005313 [Channa striata]|uniref:Uncharacterized protein n=1 Tax=Channa striata TaxID=64152 RepID=A0AA88NHE3_CHASR|nr:hypothetical protein Q5P01_005313 [Channa striata]
MAEQLIQDQPQCSAASVETPDCLHIELPHVNQDDVFLIISKCLLDIPIEHWNILKCPCCKVACDTLTALAASCMDVVQRFAEMILDIVIPQVYSYMRTHGSISPIHFRVTKDQIQAYMGDSVEQALTLGLKINVQMFSHTKVFTQLLQKHISRTVNSVLALFAQSPTLESRLPVILVSGCVASITNLKHMVNEMANMLIQILTPKHRFAECRFKSSLDKKGEELNCLSYYLNPRDHFRNKMKTYLIYMFEVLRESLEKPCQISSRNKRVVCIRVGTNTKILTVEDSESHEQKSPMDFYSNLNAIPGSVPETDKAESPFSGSLEITRETEERSHSVDQMRDIIFIRDIVDELMKVFMDDLHTEEETSSGQTAGLQLNAVKELTIRKITNSIFDLIMNGHNYQTASLLSGRHVGDTITYTSLMSGNIADRGLVAHTVYMRTEEVVTRCAVQMLLWAPLYLKKSNLLACPSPAFNATVEVDSEPPLLSRSEDELSPPVGLLVGEMLDVIGVRESDPVWVLINRAGIELQQDFDFQRLQDLHGYWIIKSYRIVARDAVAELLLKHGSFERLHELVRSKDPFFVGDVVRALSHQLERLNEPSVLGGNAAKKKSVHFLKKFKRLCCKKFSKNATKTTRITPLTVDQNCVLQGK